MRVINFPAFALVAGLAASMNVFADDFNTVLKPVNKGDSFTEAPLVSGAMGGTGRGCGWSINDYVRNCGTTSDVPAVSESGSKAIKS